MYDDARKASKDARLFNKIGIIIGIISFAISLAITFLIVIVDLIVILPWKWDCKTVLHCLYGHLMHTLMFWHLVWSSLSCCFVVVLLTNFVVQDAWIKMYYILVMVPMSAVVREGGVFKSLIKERVMNLIIPYSQCEDTPRRAMPHYEGSPPFLC